MGINDDKEDGDMTDKAREIEERKRKRVGEDAKQSAEEDEEMQIQESKEEDKMSEIKKKSYAPRRNRAVEDDNEVVIEKVLSPVNETTESPLPSRLCLARH